MTTTKSFNRQPTVIDYASPTQYKFNILKLKKVEYFCTAVNVPGINLGTANMATPLKNIPMPGDTLTYQPLSMTFLNDEYLENFQEIHGWMAGLGFPEDRKQYRDLLGAGQDRFPTSSGANNLTDGGKVKYGATDQGAVLSDATLTILTGKNNAALEIRFRDLYPTSLSGIQYDQQAEDINYTTSTVEFAYSLYTFASVGSSTTTTKVT